MLLFQKHILSDVLTSDGLLVTAKGLGIEKIVSQLLRVYCDPHQLVFVLNASQEEEEYLMREVTALATEKQTAPFCRPKALNTDFSIQERSEIYLNGGVLFVTSRILVVDMLSNRIPMNLISGLVVVNAHKLVETSNEAFIIRLFRQGNRTGFIKAFSESPEDFVRGFAATEKVMKMLFLRKLFLWPRFHVTVSDSLEAHQPEVIELRITQSPRVQRIQQAVVKVIQACLNEIKRINKTIDLTEFSVENSLFKSFDFIIRKQLDPVWHKLGFTTKQLVSDLQTLRKILNFLGRLDCVMYLQFLEGVKVREGQMGMPRSMWLLMDEAAEVLQNARDRVYSIEKRVASPPATVRKSPKSSEKTVVKVENDSNSDNEDESVVVIDDASDNEETNQQPKGPSPAKKQRTLTQLSTSKSESELGEAKQQITKSDTASKQNEEYKLHVELEPQPKWHLLRDVLNEIEQEIRDNHNRFRKQPDTVKPLSSTVLVFVKDERTQLQLQAYLRLGEKYLYAPFQHFIRRYTQLYRNSTHQNTLNALNRTNSNAATASPATTSRSAIPDEFQYRPPPPPPGMSDPFSSTKKPSYSSSRGRGRGTRGRGSSTSGTNNGKAGRGTNSKQSTIGASKPKRGGKSTKAASSSKSRSGSNGNKLTVVYLDRETEAQIIMTQAPSKQQQQQQQRIKSDDDVSIIDSEESNNDSEERANSKYTVLLSSQMGVKSETEQTTVLQRESETESSESSSTTTTNNNSDSDVRLKVIIYPMQQAAAGSKILDDMMSLREPVDIDTETTTSEAKMVRPSFIIVYDSDESAVPLIRRLEMYKSLNPGLAVRVYFMIYENSVEEQKYIRALDQEKDAFEKLIRTKASMVIPEDDSLLCELEASRQKLQDEITKGVKKSTRQATVSNTSNAPMSVIVDSREFRSSLPSLIHMAGMQVIPLTLSVGDYVLSPSICVERKSISDLFGSFNSGRLFTQAENMCRHYTTAALLIEFDPSKPFSLQNPSEIPADINPTNIISKLSLLTLHFPTLKLLWCRSSYHTAQLFAELKAQQPQPNPTVAQSIGTDDPANNNSEGDAGGFLTESSSSTNTTSQASYTAQSILRRLPGIHASNVKTVMSRVSNLAELSALSKAELTELIGAVNATQLYNFLNRDPVSLL